MNTAETHARIVIIHGVQFREKDKNNLRRLARAFVSHGYEVLLPSYGFVPAVIAGLFGWVDRRIADSMSSFIHEDDILIGHSNGCTLTYLITKHIKVRGTVLLNPALEPDLVPNADFTHVYYTPTDWVTQLSAMVPFNIWGDMGAKGYIGGDPRVRNINESEPPLPTLPPLHSHSAILDPANVRPWACYISSQVLGELNKLE